MELVSVAWRFRREVSVFESDDRGMIVIARTLSRHDRLFRYLDCGLSRDLESGCLQASSVS